MQLTKLKMKRHLVECRAQRPAGAGSPTVLYQLLVEGRGAKDYWLHLEAPADASLAELDAFLRDLWLECCGHLSEFEIAGDSYCCVTEAGRPDRRFGLLLGRLLRPEMTFLHTYDFGSSTQLTLKVVAIREAPPLAPGVVLLARNDPPDIRCGACEGAATWVCAECAWEGAGWLCEKCAESHECGEEMLLPVVNSPRVGVCGYTGP